MLISNVICERKRILKVCASAYVCALHNNSTDLFRRIRLVSMKFQVSVPLHNTFNSQEASLLVKSEVLMPRYKHRLGH